MKAMRSVLSLFLVLALLTVPALASDLEPGSGDDFYVRDTANVLSSETEQTVLACNQALEQLCDGAQFVVVTVSYLDEPVDIAANRIFNRWGIGDADQSNGMLLFLVTNTRDGGIVAGDGVDDAFYDGPADDILDDFWDDVDRDRYDDAVQGLTEDVYDWYVEYYGVEETGQSIDDVPLGNVVDYRPAPVQPVEEASGGGFFHGLGALLLLLLVFIVCVWIVTAASRFGRMRSWGYTGGFFPIFWFGGGRQYRSWYQRRPPPPPGPGPGPGGFDPGPGPNAPPRRSSFTSGLSGRGFGGHAGGGSFRSGGGFRGVGGLRGGGGGGHSGGGFRGRR